MISEGSVMGTIFGLGQCTVLRILGKDRCKVLNNLATQDLRVLHSGECKETFITDPKGKVFGHGVVAAIAEELLFVSVPGQAEMLSKHLDRYIIMEDATIQDASPKYEAWLISDVSKLEGPNSGNLERGQCKSIDIQNRSGLWIHAPWIGDRSALLLLDTTIQNADVQKAFGLPVVASSLEHREGWEAMRIDQFWPWFGQDMDAKNLPQELDRNEQAISFNKGCYLGQETIARLDALGQVQKKLVRLEISSGRLPTFENAEELALRSGDQEVGTIRSAGVRTDGSIVALGYVKRSHFDVGTELKLGADRTAKIVSSPANESN
jgi:folate-binding protein YgfZ